MRAYRTVWLAIWIPCGVVGVGVAGTSAWPAFAFLFVVFAVAGGALAFCSHTYWERPAAGRIGLLAKAALTAGTGAGAFTGYAVLLGPGALLVVAAAIASAPYVVTRGHRWLRHINTPSADQLEAMARAFAYTNPTYPFLQPPRAQTKGLGQLTDEQLCKRWRASFRASQRPASPAKLVAAVAERQVYLEELERRNSSGFRAWLAEDPQASDPLPYLTGNRHETGTVDWDELTRGQG